MDVHEKLEAMMCGEYPMSGLVRELEHVRMRRYIPQCLYDGCTGASVKHRGARFCSDLCARLYGEQQADRYTWCVQCVQWHDESCEVAG